MTQKFTTSSTPPTETELPVRARAARRLCGLWLKRGLPTVLAMFSVAIFALTGCRAVQNCTQRDQANVDPCPTCPPLCGVQPLLANTLAEIPFELRSPVTQPVSATSILGWPVDKNAFANNVSATDVSGANPALRNLSLHQCRAIAASTAPIANEIEKHREWLARNRAACPIFLDAMSQQSAQERNLQVGQAVEVYLNLANIYSQQPTIESSQSILSETKRALEKIRNADIQAPTDSTEVERQSLELVEQSIGLHKKQQQLTRGLEVLLSLETDQLPIWTELQQPIIPEQTFDIDHEFSVAIDQRGDLKMLQLLTNDCSRFTADQFRAIVAGSSPLLSASLPRPVAAAWWRSGRFKDEIKKQVDIINAQETRRRRLQLAALAQAKRQQIKRALHDVIDSLELNWQLLDVKQQRLDSLQQAIVVAEKSKDKTPLDPAVYLKNRLAAKKLQAEIIDQQFRIAIDYSKLKRVRGDFSNIETALKTPGTFRLSSSDATIGMPEAYPVYRETVESAEAPQFPTEGLLKSVPVQ